MQITDYITHLQDTLSENLYLEDTQYADRKRIMLTYAGKNPIFVCAVPAREIFEEPNNGYQDDYGGRYPTQSEVEGKVKKFLEELPNDLDLYE